MRWAVEVTARRVTVAYSTSLRPNANEPWSLHHAVVLTEAGGTICAICSIIQSMDSVVGCLTMILSGFAAMTRLTVAWTDKPPAEE
jgi:hypothetical protein